MQQTYSVVIIIIIIIIIRNRRKSWGGNKPRLTQSNIFKKCRIGKHIAMMPYIDFGFNKSLPSTSLHVRLALAMNKCLEETYVFESISKVKTTAIKTDSQKGTAPSNYRLITCLPTMCKIRKLQIREEIHNALLSHSLFFCRTKRMPLAKKRNRWSTFIWSTHLQWDQNETERCSVDNYKNTWDMVPHSLIIDCLKIYKISDKIKVHHGNRENLESRTESSWGENSERYIPGRCAVTIIICNDDDTTQSNI